eukprot:3089356-Pleurochrysis_carterae.AAC.1
MSAEAPSPGVPTMKSEQVRDREENTRVRRRQARTYPARDRALERQLGQQLAKSKGGAKRQSTSRT